MSDIKGTPGGEAGQTNVRYHDEGDGTFSQAQAAHVRGWDSTDGAWYRLPVDHATGALQVSTVGGGASTTVSNPSFYLTNTSVSVTQGAGGTSAWLTSLAGSVTVVQGTSPWLVSLSGSTAIAGTVSLGGPVAITGTVNTSLVGTVSLGGPVVVNQGTAGSSAWLTSLAGSVSVVQGTSPWLVSVGSHPVTVSGTVSLGGPVAVIGTVSTSLVNTVSLGGPVAVTGTVSTSLVGAVVEHQDVGRSPVTLYIDRVAGATAESTTSMAQTRALASLAAAATYVVTSGKTLRITAAAIEARATVASLVSSRVKIRVNSAVGAIVIPMECSNFSATTDSTGTEVFGFPDGYEIAGGTSLCMTHVENTASSTISAQVYGFEY